MKKQINVLMHQNAVSVFVNYCIDVLTSKLMFTACTCMGAQYQDGEQIEPNCSTRCTR